LSHTVVLDHNVPQLYLRDDAALVFFKNVYEAGRLGTFLDATLLTVRLWKDDVDGAFVRDCENSVGFAMRPSEGDAGKKATREDFYKLAHKWHVRVGKAFINCLEESEYMTVRNSLAVLTRVTSEFPATKRVGAHILRAAEKIQKTDTRRDLKTVAARYLAMLTKAKVNWVSEHGFNPHHPMDAKELEQKAAQEKKSKRRSAPRATPKPRKRRAPRRNATEAAGEAAAREAAPPTPASTRRKRTRKKKVRRSPRAHGSSRPRKRRAPLRDPRAIATGTCARRRRRATAAAAARSAAATTTPAARTLRPSRTPLSGSAATI
jgi:THO complex subunit 2